MWRAMKRRSWQMLLPHMGDALGHIFLEELDGFGSLALRSSSSLALTRFTRPELV